MKGLGRRVAAPGVAVTMAGRPATGPVEAQIMPTLEQIEAVAAQSS